MTLTSVAPISELEPSVEESRTQEVTTLQPTIDITRVTPEVADDEPSHPENVTLRGGTTPVTAVSETATPMVEEAVPRVLSLAFLGGCPHFPFYPILWKVIPFFYIGGVPRSSDRLFIESSF